LIALTAFTALGASAVAGTTAGNSHSPRSLLANASSHSLIQPALSAARFRAAGSRLGGGPEHARGAARRHGVDLLDGGRIDLGLSRLGPTRLSLNDQVLALATKPAAAPTPPAPPPAPVVVTPPPAPPPPPPPAPSGGIWYELRVCESGDNYSADTGNGYYGAYQFSLSTWYGLGFTGLPSQAPPAVQDRAAQELQASSGWAQWPECAAELGLT
ncbi:MAG TPA: transglycosylase family protein, partial [Acidimicrobiales bacterium]|nr:transglycosylase family protein [Acidimicrobiales bacterium]